MGPGFRPDYAQVRFSDGVETSQPFSSLTLSGWLPSPKSGLQVLTLRIPTPLKVSRIGKGKNPNTFLTKHDFERAAQEFKALALNSLESRAKTSAFEAIEVYDHLCEMTMAFNDGSAEELDRALDSAPELGCLPESRALVRIRFLQDLDALSGKAGLLVPNLKECLPLLANKGEELKVESSIRELLERKILAALAQESLHAAMQTFLNNSEYVDAGWFNQSLGESCERIRGTILKEIEKDLQDGAEFKIANYQEKADRIGLTIDLERYRTIEKELRTIEQAKIVEDWPTLAGMKPSLKSDISRVRLGQVISTQVQLLQRQVEEGFLAKCPNSIQKSIDELSIFGDTKFIRERLSKEEQRWKLAKRIENLRSELAGFQSNSFGLRCSPCFKPPELDDLSAKLILDWVGHQSPTSEHSSDLVYQECHERNHQVARMWSARNAELASAEYWRTLGQNSEDISIHQITRQSNSWRYYDLMVAGLCIDVKNARTSFASKKNYSDVCVSRFKRDRSFGSDVLIQGVLSTYVRPEEMANSENHDVTILGLVSEKEIRDFEHSVADLTKGRLSIQTLQRNGKPPKFIPGWLFEHPGALYANPDHNQERFRQFLTKWQEAELGLKEIPPAILLIGYTNKVAGVSLDLFEINEHAVEIVAQVIDRHGLKLRSIVMGVILACIRCKRLAADVFRPADLKRLLFLDSDSKKADSPLGLYDPFEYVNSFINVFETIYEKNRDALASYDRFKLQGASILMGSRGDSLEWETIIAYCGGLDPHYHVACGKNPIFLGESAHCGECHRLICPECGFCAEQCPERLVREERRRSQVTLDDDISF